MMVDMLAEDGKGDSLFSMLFVHLIIVIVLENIRYNKIS